MNTPGKAPANPGVSFSENPMKILLSLSRRIDALNARIGQIVLWLILLCTLISAINATVRKAFNTSSNAYLEIQWYLFAAVFLLGAGYTFLKDEHVRIDALSQRFSRRTQIKIDVVGIVVFLLPLCAWVVVQSWPLVANAYTGGEVSTNAGGLIRWPVYALIPAGFFLLALQSLSELVKRVAFLTGHAPDPAIAIREKKAEEKLLEELRARQAHTETQP
jgi:TRAP-type mannitol/chloroaromatic compound transport system permease small subunit